MKESNWWKGTQNEWCDLLLQERERIAFEKTGCDAAWPLWHAPVKCLHVGCRIKRGELPPIAETEAVLNGERENGWLRFMSEERYQQLRDAMLKYAEKTGIYDPWKQPGGWQAMVFSAIGD